MNRNALLALIAAASAQQRRADDDELVKIERAQGKREREQGFFGHGGMHLAELIHKSRQRQRARQTHPGKRAR